MTRRRGFVGLFSSVARWRALWVLAATSAAALTPGLAPVLVAEAGPIRAEAHLGCGDTAGLIVAMASAARPTTIYLNTDNVAGCGYEIAKPFTKGQIASSPDGLPPVIGSLEIVGNGSTIRRVGTKSFRILEVAATGDLTLSDATISGGNIDGNYVAETAYGTIGTSGSGGGVVNQGTLTLVRTRVAGNSAGTMGAGGGINNAGRLTMTDTSIVDNSALQGGGLYSSSGPGLTMDGGEISANHAESSGGGAYFTGGNQVIRDAVIIDNVSGDEGGGIENTGSLTLERTQVSDNDGGSGNGGGINNEGRLSMTGGSLARNRSRWNGGGLQQLGYALLTDVTIDQNQASGWYRPAFYYSHGGGIAIGNTTTYQWDAWTYISGGTITNNWAQDGGGIFSDGTRVTVQGTSFAGNSPNNCSPAFAGC